MANDANFENFQTVTTQALLDSVSAHIAIIDSDGLIVAVNRSWKQFASENGTPKSFVGENYFSICEKSFRNGDEIAHQAQQGILSVFNQDRRTYELEYPCHSPAVERWFTMQVSLIPGAPRLAMIMHHNVTEKVAIEHMARRSERKSRDLFMNSPTPMAITDVETSRYLDVNDAFLLMFGATRNDVVGRTALEMKHVSVEDEAKIRSAFFRNGRVQDYRIRLLTSDGVERHFSLWVEPISTEDKTQTLTRAFEITDLVAAQSELAALQRQLDFDTKVLAEKQMALRQVTGLIEQEREAIRVDVRANIDFVIGALLRSVKLRSTNKDDEVLRALEHSIHEVTDPFVAQLHNQYPQLTKHELLLCVLVRSGMSSKVIARTLGVTLEAVHKARLRLRAKLGLTESRTETVDFLREFSGHS